MDSINQSKINQSIINQSINRPDWTPKKCKLFNKNHFKRKKNLKNFIKKIIEIEYMFHKSINKSI